MAKRTRPSSIIKDGDVADYALAAVLTQASSGHKLGQMVGDWFQDDFVQPILREVARDLDLYLDDRQRKRSARGEKILWNDEYGNAVDYDFVMELGGTDSKRGVPVAFLECFWRRGSRHSKDKARDDSGKLVPMRHVYPAARFLGIVASGDFTKPAKDLILSRELDLFYVPKTKVIEAFKSFSMEIDYDDKAGESEKAEIAARFRDGLSADVRRKAASKLRSLLSETVVQGYVDRVRAKLRALPQEVRIVGALESAPIAFESVDQAYAFLQKPVLEFDFANPTQSYRYEVTYSDGMEFARSVKSDGALRELNGSIKALSDHMARLT